MSKQQKGQPHTYSKDQLKEGHEGPVVVMICRKWDVHTINGWYLSTAIVASVEKVKRWGQQFKFESQIWNHLVMGTLWMKNVYIML